MMIPNFLHLFPVCSAKIYKLQKKHLKCSLIQVLSMKIYFSNSCIVALVFFMFLISTEIGRIGHEKLRIFFVTSPK